jgi:hypothetical protein
MVGNQTQGLSDEAIREATGRTWQEWMSVLDGWRVGNPSLVDVTRHLMTRYHLRQFWGQTIAVYYSLVHCRHCGDWLRP